MKQRLGDSISDYELFRVSQGRAKATIRNERSVLLALLTSVGNIYTCNLTERHVTAFLSGRAATREAGSLALDHAVLSVFFKWCRTSRRMPRDHDPMAGRSRPRVTQRERDRVHVSKFPALLDAAGRRDPRDRMFIALGIYTLSRLSEIINLRIRDVDLDAGYLRTRVEKSHLEDRMPVSSELDAEIRSWLTRYARSAGSLEPDWYLVPGRRLASVLGATGDARTVVTYAPTSRITQASARIVKPALAAIGFTLSDRDNLRGEGAHTLRRSAARALFDRLASQGHDQALRIVQAMLHHKNVAQTETYIGVTADRRTRDDLFRGQRMYNLPEVKRLEITHGDSETDSRVV